MISISQRLEGATGQIVGAKAAALEAEEARDAAVAEYSAAAEAARAAQLVAEEDRERLAARAKDAEAGMEVRLAAGSGTGALQALYVYRRDTGRGNSREGGGGGAPIPPRTGPPRTCCGRAGGCAERAPAAQAARAELATLLPLRGELEAALETAQQGWAAEKEMLKEVRPSRLEGSKATLVHRRGRCRLVEGPGDVRGVGGGSRPGWG